MEFNCTLFRASHCSVVKESACQCRRHRRHWFDPWRKKFPWRRKWQPSILAGIIPWTEDPGRLQSMGSQRVRPGWRTEHAHIHIQCMQPCLIPCREECLLIVGQWRVCVCVYNGIFSWEVMPFHFTFIDYDEQWRCILVWCWAVFFKSLASFLW